MRAAGTCTAHLMCLNLTSKKSGTSDLTGMAGAPANLRDNGGGAPPPGQDSAIKPLRQPSWMFLTANSLPPCRSLARCLTSECSVGRGGFTFHAIIHHGHDGRTDAVQVCRRGQHQGVSHEVAQASSSYRLLLLFKMNFEPQSPTCMKGATNHSTITLTITISMTPSHCRGGWYWPCHGTWSPTVP